jgi:dipeptidyl-peptidase-3
MRSEFSWDEAEASRSQKFATFSGELTTDMHEVIGHASGKQAEGKANPQALIKEFFSALEKGAPTWSACISSPIRSSWSSA